MVFLVTLVAVTTIQFLLSPETVALYRAQPELSKWLFISVLILLPSITISMIVGLAVAINRRADM